MARARALFTHVRPFLQPLVAVLACASREQTIESVPFWRKK